MFEDILKEAELKFIKKSKEYGNSWKTMEIEKLQIRLNEEVEEWESSRGERPDEYQELLDVINVACMLATRLKNVSDCSICCNDFDTTKTTAKDKSFCSKKCEKEYYDGEDEDHLSY